MAKGEIEKTEKITINLGLVDLGQIDLLVQEGFYANPPQFIRTAIRNQRATRSEALDQTAARRTLTLGSSYYTRRDLEELRDAGQMIHIRVLGLASIADDVAPQMKAMTEATRLTREGRLAEATALIQQTLAGPAAPWRTPDAPSAGDETGRTPGDDPNTPPALPPGQRTKLRRAIPGWLTRRRPLPAQGDDTLGRPTQPATPTE